MAEEYLAFWPEVTERPIEADEDLWFIYNGQDVLMQDQDETIQLPTRKNLVHLQEELKEGLYLGKLRGQACYALSCEGKEHVLNGYVWGSIRDLRWMQDEQLYYVTIKGMQLLGWHQNTRYCGKCGSPTEMKEDERAKCCPECGLVQYPRLSPAVIVGITKGDQILLARNVNFRKSFYGIISGFVEQGETLEEAVRREAMEEVGIRVKNITYLESKPWSSGDAFMIGFLAEYDSGEINIDGKEIVAADWFSKDHLPPEIPSKLTIARTIIDKALGLE